MRTVADVECREKDADKEQIQAGFAWYYVRYGWGYEHLAQIEQQAREAGRGAWSMQTVPPWKWRKR